MSSLGLRICVAVALEFAITFLGALVSGPSPVRKGIGIALGILGMGCAFIVPPEHSIIRSILVVAEFCGAMRLTDMRKGTWPLAERLVHMTSVVDHRKLVRIRPRLDLTRFLAGAAWLAAGVVLYQVWWMNPPGAALRLAIRWGVGLLFIYTVTEAAYRWISVAYQLAGFLTPKLHDHPAAATSVQEFWGERWNRTVSSWLGETFFLPLARRRRPALGAALAFFVSALVHAYLAWVAVGLAMGVVMFGFFAAQAVVIGLERLVALRKWPRPLAHAWTLTWMVGLSPMFIEPTARAMGL